MAAALPIAVPWPYEARTFVAYWLWWGRSVGRKWSLRRILQASRLACSNHGTPGNVFSEMCGLSAQILVYRSWWSSRCWRELHLLSHLVLTSIQPLRSLTILCLPFLTRITPQMWSICLLLQLGLGMVLIWFSAQNHHRPKLSSSQTLSRTEGKAEWNISQCNWRRRGTCSDASLHPSQRASKNRSSKGILVLHFHRSLWPRRWNDKSRGHYPYLRMSHQRLPRTRATFRPTFWCHDHQSKSSHSPELLPSLGTYQETLSLTEHLDCNSSVRSANQGKQTGWEG